MKEPICPWCRKKAWIGWYERGYVVRCTNHACRGIIAECCRYSRNGAIKAWNRWLRPLGKESDAVSDTKT